MKAVTRGLGPPSACAVLLACALLPSCAKERFDHAPRSQSLAPDGGAPVPASCRGQDDGTPCDDGDVCTPSSRCEAGECMPGNAFDDCTIVDSAVQLMETQGEAGWYYGYWNADADPDGSYDPETDFAEMEYCGEMAWRPPGVCGTEEDGPGHRWTSNLGWGLQHPETQPDVELPVRRWISDVSGPATMLLEHHTDGVYGDGTRALLLIDGEEVWRNDAMAGDTVGTKVELPVELRVGSVLEQLVHPLESSADDTTYFALRIEG